MNKAIDVYMRHGCIIFQLFSLAHWIYIIIILAVIVAMIFRRDVVAYLMFEEFFVEYNKGLACTEGQRGSGLNT